jgi:hypothetical protein
MVASEIVYRRLGGAQEVRKVGCAEDRFVG